MVKSKALLFEKEEVKKATHLTDFIGFINEIVPLYEEEIPFTLLQFIRGIKSKKDSVNLLLLAYII